MKDEPTMTSTATPGAEMTPTDAAIRTGVEPLELPELVIEPRRGWVGIDWRELVHFRELLYFLVWRDVKVRYKQTVLGVAWAVLQPLLSMAIFTVIFGKLAKLPSDGLPYAVFVLVGLVPWTFFATAVGQSAQSLVNQQHLLTKVYFPRMFMPAAAVGVALVDLAISFGVLAVFLAIYRVGPGWGVAAVPLLVLLTLLVAMGMGLLLSAVTVMYRDFKYVVPFMLQAWMYLSPVVYPVSLVPRRLQWVLALNPMAGIIDGFRSALLGKEWNWGALGVSAAVSGGVFVLGLFCFRRMERRFADVI
jgi:lipopolysaccharide transport system permease protein